jgi:predicted CDP-diglyceride synthetase/phosphatidate cytidylyltransferase
MNLLQLASPQVWTVLGWDCVVLGTATAVVNIHPKIRRLDKVRHAIQSWWPVVFVTLLAVCLGSAATLLSLATVSTFLILEGLRLVPLDERLRRTYTAFGILITWACHGLLLFRPQIAFLIPLGVTFLILPVLHMILVGAKDYVKQVGGNSLDTQCHHHSLPVRELPRPL